MAETDFNDEMKVIRPAVQRHKESGKYTAVIHVTLFDTKEEAERVAMILYRSSIEKLIGIGVKTGPPVN
jgi:hypothetical protein